MPPTSTQVYGAATATSTPIAATTATRTSTATPTATRRPARHADCHTEGEHGYADATPTKAATATPTPAGSQSGGGVKIPVSQSVNFDTLPSAGRALSGQSPSGLIEWGSNGWFLSGPYDKFHSNSVSFNKGLSSATLTFLKPTLLTAVDVDNGGESSTTVNAELSGSGGQAGDSCRRPGHHDFQRIGRPVHQRDDPQHQRLVHQLRQLPDH